MVSISVVVPVYSGGIYLEQLVSEVEQLRARWEENQAPMRIAEILFVDDAAIDNSPELLDRIASEKSWVTVIHLARNYGQHAATVAGLLHSSGDWVVTLDEDLQHPPALIEDLLRKAVRKSSDIVYARANARVHDHFIRDMGSRGFKRMVEFLSGNKNIRYFNSFRLIRGPIARAASSTCGHETYFDISLSWFTQRVDHVPMTLKDLRFIETGKSGYKLSKLLSHARKMLMSSQVKIMRLMGLFGLIVVAAAAVGALWVLLQRIFAPETIGVGGWASLAVISLFFGGFVSFGLGIVLEYLSALVLIGHGKPVFFVVDRSCDRDLEAFFESANVAA